MDDYATFPPASVKFTDGERLRKDGRPVTLRVVEGGWRLECDLSRRFAEVGALELAVLFAAGRLVMSNMPKADRRRARRGRWTRRDGRA